MSEAIAIILAAGKATRWHGDVTYSSKHWIDVFGEPLIARLLRQLSACGIAAVILGNTPQLLAFPGSFNPDCRMKSQSIIQAEHLWAEQTHILCGDVLFSDSAMKEVAFCREPVRFFCDETANELFGYSFNRENHQRMKEWCPKASMSSGNLWNIFRAAIGVDQNIHVTDHPWLYRIKDDRVTRDFDTWIDYAKWRSEQQS